MLTDLIRIMFTLAIIATLYLSAYQLFMLEYGRAFIIFLCAIMQFALLLTLI